MACSSTTNDPLLLLPPSQITRPAAPVPLREVWVEENGVLKFGMETRSLHATIIFQQCLQMDLWHLFQEYLIGIRLNTEVLEFFRNTIHHPDNPNKNEFTLTQHQIYWGFTPTIVVETQEGPVEGKLELYRLILAHHQTHKGARLVRDVLDRCFGQIVDPRTDWIELDGVKLQVRVLCRTDGESMNKMYRLVYLQ